MTNYNAPVNQLVFVVVSGRQAEDLMQVLIKERFYFTRVETAGPIFQDPTVCLLIGLNNSRNAVLLGLISQACPPRKEYVPVQFTPPAGFPPLSMIETQINGALIYTVEVDRFEQY